MRMGAPQRGHDHAHVRVEPTDDAMTGEGGATAKTCDRSEIVRAAPRREQAEVANADKAFRQDVQEEAPEEFVDVECHVRIWLPCR